MPMSRHRLRLFNAASIKKKFRSRRRMRTEGACRSAAFFAEPRESATSAAFPAYGAF